MKIVVISDTHYGLKSADYDRNSEIHSIVTDAIQWAIHNGADYFVHCGDLGHVANPSSEVHGLWAQIFETLEDNEIQSYFMLGNHDVVKDVNRPYGSLAPLRKLEYNYVKAINRDTFGYLGDLFAVFLPYFNQAYVGADHNTVYNDVLNIHEKYKKAKRVIAFTHLNVPNASTDNDFLLRPVQAVIPQELYDNDNVELIISGHIHKPQNIGKNIVIGSPICTDFGDLDNKRFLCLNVGENGIGVDSIPTNHTKLVELNYDFVEQDSISLVLPDSIQDAGIKVKLRLREDQLTSVNVEQLNKDITKKAKFVRPIVPTIVRIKGERRNIIKAGMNDIEIVDAWLEDKYTGEDSLVRESAISAIEVTE